MPRTAAALVIGDELLSGKIQDENVAFLGRELFALGIRLRRVVMCPDDVEQIARDVRALAADHDLVFTSGGVGPTHDDVTMEGLATAFGRPLVRAPEVEAMLRGFYGDRITEGHLRMATMPEGATLVRTAAIPWPIFVLENVYVFPGVPELFRMKFPALRERIGSDAAFVTRELYTRCDEGEIAVALAEVQRAHPDVAIGSYPRWRDDVRRVKLTFDGTSAEAIERAVAAVLALLPEGVVVPPA